jgi:hypothetical protein
MTGLVPVLWAVWGVLALLLVSLKVYTDRLARDEDDQIILDDAFDNLKVEQAAIVARVNKVTPLKKVTLWLFVAASVVVAGYYVMDIVNQFK